jgi:hypothetical protein
MTKTDRYSVQTDEDTPTPQMPTANDIFIGRSPNIPRRPVERTRFGAFKITSLGLEIGEGAQEKDWQEAGEFIFQVDSAIQWLVGDWLLYGVSLRYGDMPRFAEQFGRDESTLHTYKQMAENIEYTRRRVDLSFAHHQEVRKLPPAEQDRALAYAAENGFNRSDFRKWIKQGMPADGLPVAIPSPAQPASNDSAREEFYGTYIPETNRFLFGVDRLEDLSKEHRKEAAQRAQWLSDFYATAAKELKG